MNDMMMNVYCGYSRRFIERIKFRAANGGKYSFIILTHWSFHINKLRFIVIKSNSDYHSQLIMKQKDYRFSSLWIWAIADLLYFSVLAWLIHFFAAKERRIACPFLTPGSPVHRTPMHLYIQQNLCLE